MSHKSESAFPILKHSLVNLCDTHQRAFAHCHFLGRKHVLYWYSFHLFYEDCLIAMMAISLQRLIVWSTGNSFLSICNYLRAIHVENGPFCDEKQGWPNIAIFGPDWGVNWHAMYVRRDPVKRSRKMPFVTSGHEVHTCTDWLFWTFKPLQCFAPQFFALHNLWLAVSQTGIFSMTFYNGIVCDFDTLCSW